MSHLVKPTTFRAGKTFIWQYNSFVKSSSSNFTRNPGLNRLSRRILKRKRLYVVSGTVVNYVNKQLRYNLLYAPKIKSKPREHRTGSFVQRSVYKAYNWAEESEAAKLYVHRRIEKIAKLTKLKNVRINK